MSTLPLEVHEVIEEEYVSMYGRLALPPSKSNYTAEQILDESWARRILATCGIAGPTVVALNALVATDSPAELRKLAELPHISAAAKALLDDYEQHIKETLPERQKEIIRRILATCGIAGSPVVDALNALVATDSPAELRKLADAAKALLDDYEQHIKETLPERQKEIIRRIVDDALERQKEINRRIVDDALTGAVRRLVDMRLDNVYTALHKRAKADGKSVGKPRTALCISGGGIRSATFGLGVIQGLASARILDKFDYLSTVSGGGYIGSWLSSWIRRHPRGVSGVQEDLQRADTAVASSRPAISDGAPQDRELPERKIDPEPEPLLHLRAYSNYLSPRLGLFSGDSWTLASLYIRNLLLNLLVLVPLLALALAFPRIFSWILQFSYNLDTHTRLHPSAWIWIAAGLATLGFAYLGQKRPVEQGEKAQKKARTITTDGRFIVWCVLPLTGAAIALSVFWARAQQHDGLLTHPSTLAAVISAAIGMTLVPYLLYYRRIEGSLPAERRATFIKEADFKKKLKSKRGAEAFAMTVALLIAIALLFLLAVKVFDKPLLDVPTVAAMAPIDRAGLPAWPQAQFYVVFAVPLLLLVFFVQASIFVGLSSHHNEDSDREWLGRAGAWLIAFAVGLALFSAIAVFGPIAFYYAPVILASVGGAAGLVAALLGYSGKTPANQKEKEEGGMTAKAGNFASALTVPLFIAALLAVISLGCTWLIQQFHDEDPKITEKYARQAVLQAQFTTTEQTKAGVQTLRTTPSPRVSIPALKAVAHLQTIQQTSGLQVLIFLVVALIAVGLSFFIGINKFSMNALYRNRIIRAYLGASRYGRDPDRFTGFDENDNLQMWELRPELLWATSFRGVSGLVDALKNGEAGDQKKLGAYIWKALDAQTRDRFPDPPAALPGCSARAPENEVNGVSIDALVQNLNSILLKDDLSAAGVKAPGWLETTSSQIGYPRPLRNRAILDQHFGKWIVPMAPPADADGAPNPALPRRGPMHVVNIALNLTGGQNLAWQQRRAESFTASPHHSGSLYLGYRPSREYGGEDGISLGTAVSISGAAASPNMGYHSSPTMAFLLAFFNIRLGSWLGNPGPHGQKSYKEKHPTTGLVPMFEELTGNSTDTSKWVYLSDGGHFENLALYEMVVRRCHKIVLSDAGADPKCTFEDLGNAIRKIRTDLGVPIDIADIKMFPRAKDGKPVKGEYVAFGKIRYSAVDKDAEDGELIYIKPGVYEGDYFPRDVYNYSQESLQFPHESTSDQFFSESQFESYRALGRHAVNEICKNYDPAVATAPEPRTGPEPRFPIVKTYTSVAEFTKFIMPTRQQQPPPPAP